MGSSISELSKLLGQKKGKISMVGPLRSGKTTIYHSLANDKVTMNSIPTINCSHFEAFEYEGLCFTIYNFIGGDQMNALWRHYLEVVDGIVYVVDSNDGDQVNEAKDQLKWILNVIKSRSVPLLVMANKQDCLNALSIAEMTEKLQLVELLNSKLFVQGTSGITGQGLKEGIDWLSNAVSY